MQRAASDDDRAELLQEYAELLKTIASVGPEAGTPPEIHIMIPPPLMEQGAYGMNQ